MGEAIRDYEIRLSRADGALSIVMLTSAISDADAKAQAYGMLKDGLASAEIWQGLTLTDTISQMTDGADKAA
jgi:hypothetical protein